MKKDLIFAPILLVIGILLGLFKVTGMTAHIIISVVGVAVLVAGFLVDAVFFAAVFFASAIIITAFH